MSCLCQAPSNLESSKKMDGSKMRENIWGQNGHISGGQEEWMFWKPDVSDFITKQTTPKHSALNQQPFLELTILWVSKGSGYRWLWGVLAGLSNLQGFGCNGSALPCVACQGPQPRPIQMLVTGISYLEQVPMSTCTLSLRCCCPTGHTILMATRDSRDGERSHFLMGVTFKKSWKYEDTGRGNLCGQCYNQPHLDTWELV